jgi:hypothetical protein
MDDWQECVTLLGTVVPIVSQINYFSIIISNNYSSKNHITKRKQFSYATIGRIEKLGFTSENVSPKLRGNMYKTYAKSVIMYGSKTLETTQNDMKKLASIEDNTVKSMLDIDKRCYSKYLYNSLQINLNFKIFQTHETEVPSAINGEQLNDSNN